MNSIFPRDFLWGSATHAHQVEGNNHNDWAVWEKKNADYLAKTAQKRWDDELRMKGVTVPLPSPEEKSHFGFACMQNHCCCSP